MKLGVCGGGGEVRVGRIDDENVLNQIYLK
jgi:hypothetical protein